jgi:Na+-transporting methylmalonyl-CoA/oxaloacetate decarboxylase gamma subunit
LPEVRSLSALLLYGIVLPASGGTVDTNVQVEGSSQFTGMYGNKVKVLQGRFFDPHDPRPAMVDEQLAHRDHLRPGSTLHLLGVPNDAQGNPDASRAFPMSFRVSGIAPFDDQIVPANRANGYPRALLTPAFFRVPAYAGLHGSDAGAITLRTGASRAAFLRQANSLASSPQFSAETGGHVFIGDLDGQAEATERAIRPEGIALALFAALAGLIALVVVSQLIGRQILLDAAEHPVLRALGMSRRDLVVFSLLRVGIVTFFGALVAVAVSIAASPLMPIGPARLAEPNPAIEVNLAILGVGFVIWFIVLLLLVIPVTWRAASRFGPVGASVPTREESRARLLSALAAAPGALTGSVGLRMALDPGRGRTAVPVRSALVGMTIALAALVAAFVFGASLLHLVDTPRLYGQSWDREVDLQFGSVPARFLNTVVSSQRGVASYAIGNYAPFGTLDIAGVQVPAIGIDSSRGSFLTLLEGLAPAAQDEIALGARTLQMLHLRTGQSLKVTINGHTHAMHIVGEAVFAAFSRGSFDATDLGNGAALVASDLSVPNPSTGCPPGPTCYNFALVRFRSGTNLAAAGKGLGRAVVAAGCPVGSCSIVADQRPSDIENYNRIRNTPVVLGGVLTLLALATLAHMLVTGVRRRRRDLAVLKTFGLLRRQVSAVVAWQASALTVAALAVGLPLGILAGRASWTFFAGSVGVPGDAEVPLLIVLLIIPVALVVANLIATGPGWAAGRTPIAQVLRSE